MAHVVTGNCQKCMYTDCVAVCPVDCFYTSEEDQMLFIHPDECIDCGACIPECPVEAIYAEDEVPDDMQSWIADNAEKCEAGNLEQITEKQDELPTAEEKRKELGL